MRVAQLTCVYPPYGGGIGRVARSFARALAPEHQVTVVTPRYRKGTTFTRDVGVALETRRPLVAWGLGAYLGGLRRALRAYDVVHLHHPFFGVHELLGSLRPPTRLVVTYHMAPQVPGLKGWLMGRDLAYSEPRLARRAKLLTIATKDYLEAVVLPRLGEPGKWRVLPFGVEDRFNPGEKPDQLVRRYGVREREAVILFVGTLDARHGFKGLEVLFHALTRLSAYRWRLLVVGGGSGRARFESLARALALQRQVIFTGFVTEAELPAYYRVADVFAFPSLNRAESFGLVVLQAMATGLPVVASRLAGVRELVRDGETGLSVPPGDPLALAAALEHLLVSPPLMRQLGERARHVVMAEYQEKVIQERLRALYREL